MYEAVDNVPGDNVHTAQNLLHAKRKTKNSDYRKSSLTSSPQKGASVNHPTQILLLSFICHMHNHYQ